MPATFGIVDLFAGPGGLGEGFTSLTSGNHKPFRIALSVEKEASAHRTLTLRSFLRAHQSRHGQLPGAFINFHAGLTGEPDWSTIDPASWTEATSEARNLELGTDDASNTVDDAIASLRHQCDDTILIGGPPCQAYSLAGRSRSRGVAGYVPEEDKRHYLFREYIRVLDKLRPAAFVMENVKGILSSTVEKRLVFEMLMETLASLGRGSGHFYELRAIRVTNGRASLHEATQPSDYTVRAEEFGIPQRRHRVIIIGIRSDLSSRADAASIAVMPGRHTVKDVIGTLPALRSGISRGGDNANAWQDRVDSAAARLSSICRSQKNDTLMQEFRNIRKALQVKTSLPRSSSRLPASYGTSDDELLRWLERPALKAIAQHETRGHMLSDLDRYLFASTFGKVYHHSPRAENFPDELHPEHRNWRSGAFNDRFRVQLANEPSTTITSHISKDGHYFIHPDPLQCRSLTVREAARLQTFPDDYFFLGNRTQQYVQVGNAVPPCLARQIAQLVLSVVTGTDSSI